LDDSEFLVNRNKKNEQPNKIGPESGWCKHGRRQRGAGGPWPSWIFKHEKHDTDKVEERLMCYYSVLFFPWSLPGKFSAEAVKFKGFIPGPQVENIPWWGKYFKEGKSTFI